MLASARALASMLRGIQQIHNNTSERVRRLEDVRKGLGVADGTTLFEAAAFYDSAVSAIIRRYLEGPGLGDAKVLPLGRLKGTELLPRTRPEWSAKIPLSEALNLLMTNDGADLVESFRAYAQKHGANLRAPLDLDAKPPLPEDPLACAIVEFFHTKRGFGLHRNVLNESELRTLLPHAITSALAICADSAGRIEVQSLIDHLGWPGVRLYNDLAKRLEWGQGLVDSPRPGARYRFLREPAALAVARSARPVPWDRMPALLKISDRLDDGQTLKGHRLAAKWHMFLTSSALVELLEKHGIDPADGYVEGKPASVHPGAGMRAHARGWNVRTEERLGDATAPGDDFEFLNHLFQGVDPTKETKRRFVLVNDGADKIRLLHQYEGFRPYLKLVTCVEQTEGGVLALEEMEKNGTKLQCPVIKMGRAWLKKLVEGAIVGESVVYHVERALADAQKGFEIKPKRAVILGFGAVGRAVAAALERRGYEIWVWDKDPNVKIPEKYKTGTREEVLANGHLTIAATPDRALGADEYGLLPKRAVLVNAGSGNSPVGADQLPQSPATPANELEFLGLIHGHHDPSARDGGTGDPEERADGVGRRWSKFDGKEILLGDLVARDPCHHRVVRAADGGERLLLRNGFVVNMTLGIPPEFVQVTLGLLLASILEAAKRGDELGPGLHDLSDASQWVVHDEVKAQLDAMGLDFDVPRFERTPPMVE